MTIDQAVAILDAERVLQGVGAEGPDTCGFSAWRDYVEEAGRVIQGDPLFRNAYNDITLLNCGCENCNTPATGCIGACTSDGGRCTNCGCEE